MKIMYWNEHTRIIRLNFNGRILSDVLWMDEN